MLPPDLALLMAGGVAEVSVHRPLRVGVLSTGNELFEAGQNAGAAGIYDANRPMLLDLVRQWGHRPIDLGICRAVARGPSGACADRRASAERC